ncbi:hypothetical protein PILCRDRAFT_527122 [Piloderma croceum F 1598]|uniref:Uncharacterized protein n=1 Tax=Piloderma croceum (strain F 1598) TaxID=765440 RepID=A0A0C3B326_PILCF|nr:hypothetical protein PILCRDRAFT_527122 [Piloderma croceum F 1598]
MGPGSVPLACYFHAIVCCLCYNYILPSTYITVITTMSFDLDYNRILLILNTNTSTTPNPTPNPNAPPDPADATPVSTRNTTNDADPFVDYSSPQCCHYGWRGSHPPPI